MRKSLRHVTILLVTAAGLSTVAGRVWSQDEEFVAPTVDIPDSADPGILKRYEGSVILSYYYSRYDEFTYPLSELISVEGKRDSSNNRAHEPKEKMTQEGPYTRVVYLTPPDRSPLEVLRNYQKEIEAMGGKIVYECKEAECGGDETRSSGGGGGRMSLSMYLFPSNKLTDRRGTPGWCVTGQRIKSQRYIVAEIPDKGAYVSALVYQPSDSSYTNCLPYIDRTIAIVDLIEGDKMEDKMVVVDSKKMSEEIADSGSISLYGIHFESGETAIKQESNPTIEEIAKLLAAEPDLKLRVVGHTDSEGSFEYNRDLSQRRAEAVVAMLVDTYGVAGNRLTALGASYSSPVATNRTKEGKAMNRRVTLVEE
jgi:outer membrane protein OmpA-like peptidoglycan-associated protein